MLVPLTKDLTYEDFLFSQTTTLKKKTHGNPLDYPLCSIIIIMIIHRAHISSNKLHREYYICIGPNHSHRISEMRKKTLEKI